MKIDDCIGCKTTKLLLRRELVATIERSDHDPVSDIVLAIIVLDMRRATVGLT